MRLIYSLAISVLLLIPIGSFAYDGPVVGLDGVVMDSETREVIPFAYVHLEQINRSVTTDRDGKFTFTNIPQGTYTVTIHRIGYTTKQVQIDTEIVSDERVEILLDPTSLTGETVIVEDRTERLKGANLEHASQKVSGNELRRNLGSTISETLSNQPGFAQRSMGAAPSRPVIRGLGGERVLILQDGGRSGDVSSASPDHAVSIDPIGADEIEIARGPAALAYGSNAIGGVVNVVKNQIPTVLPSSITGVASIQGNSVNNGASAAGNVKLPYRDFVANVDLNARYGMDFNSPEGRIENTNIVTSNSAVGLSYIQPWGYSGVSFTSYLSNYGIPPDPDGGHPNGVDIEMQKYQLEARTEIVLENHFLKTLEIKGSFTNYKHQEFETATVIGTNFEQLTSSGGLSVTHQPLPYFDDGVVGVWGEFIDYSVIGARTPRSDALNTAIYTIQETDIGRLHVELGARYEFNISKPKQERTSNRIGEIRKRTFSGLASSASLIYDLGTGFSLGTVLMHSYRTPSLEELYSEGPHLAAYSFEIGNPDLDPERGFGKELFLRYNSATTSFQIAGYHNSFNNYMYARDTGRQNTQFSNLNDYQFVGVDAVLYGAEASGELKLTNQLTAGGGISYTIGSRNVDESEQEITGIESSETPLPMIPPLQGNLNLNYNVNRITLTGKMLFATEQTRLGEFEESTDGYQVFEMSAQYRFDRSGLLHTFTLNGSNLLNQTYRNHLSRVKEIFPEPGRSINLLYRLYF